jgi:CRISPR system Cascade subunit CasC
MIINIHALQNVATSRLNTNKDGSLKTINLGGTNRVRVSSQSWKRAMRNYTHEQGLISTDQLAYRSRLLNENIKARLLQMGKDETLVDAVVEATFAALGMKLSKENRNEYLIFYGSNELEAMLKIIESNWDVLSNLVFAGEKKKDRNKEVPVAISNQLKAVFSSIANTEIALYGRQLADLPEGNADGAIQIAHAISINPLGDSSDFFTAVDDLQSGGGSGYLEERQISAPVLYRCGSINVTQLQKAIGLDATIVAINAFFEAFVHSFPSSGKTGFAAASLPEFVMLERTDHHMLNHSGAFEKPINFNIMGQGIERLGIYTSKIEKMYPRMAVAKRVIVSIHDAPSFVGATVSDSITDAIREVQQ